MKKIFLPSCLALCLGAIMAASPAEASPKYLSWWWWPSHWINQDFKPYYQDGQLPHNSQWDTKSWEPEDWVYLGGGDPRALMQKFYNAGLINEQDFADSDEPSLEIGPNFYHLSGYDKERVAATVYSVHQIDRNALKMFYLKDGVTDKIIGYYSKPAGLILE